MKDLSRHCFRTNGILFQIIKNGEKVMKMMNVVVYARCLFTKHTTLNILKVIINSQNAFIRTPTYGN